MPHGDVFDGNEVQAGVDVSGDLAVKKVEDDVARGRWLPIARAHGGSGIDDHHRLAVAGGFQEPLASARNFERL